MLNRISIARISIAWIALLPACSSENSAGPLADGGVEPDMDPWPERALWTQSEPYDCDVQAAPDDAFVDLLGQLGLDLDLGVPRSYYETFGGSIADDPSRKSWFHELQENARTIPCFAASAATRADETRSFHHPLTALIGDAAATLDLAIQVGGSWPALDEKGPLLGALDALHGGSTWAGRDDVAAAIAGVPADVALAASKILRGLQEAIAARDAALEAIAPGADLETIRLRLPNTYLPSNSGSLNPSAAEDVVYLAPDAAAATTLYEGAARLAQAIDEAGLSEIGAADSFGLLAPTPYGAVVLRGAADDVYDPAADENLAGPILLLIDTGGADEYLIAAGATLDHTQQAGVLVDLGGDDTYGYEVDPSPRDLEGLLPSDAAGRYPGDTFWGPFSRSNAARQGSGILGYGFLLDLGGGDDVYRTLRFGQGFGALGVGLLFDDGGIDDYIGEAGTQGAGFGGIGLLVDGGGQDSYRAFYSSQGHARPSGYGLLYDVSGDDTYELVPSDPQVYNWFDGFQDNLSMGQGASTGYRASDCIGGTCLSGGFAMLRDADGNDTYRASVMSQGEGYWMGMGVLADRSGDDRYEALVYSQGSSQHFALAAFLEGGGNDIYNADSPIQHALPGLSHDFSVTVFVDDGGNDVYRGSSGSMGAGKCHGMAIFVDNGGNDSYTASDDFSLGWARDYDGTVGNCGNWTNVPTYGLFVDASGTDIYSKPTLVDEGDGNTWITEDPADATAIELSGGTDADTGPVVLRAYGEVMGVEIP